MFRSFTYVKSARCVAYHKKKHCTWRLQWVPAKLVKDPTRVTKKQLSPQLPTLRYITTARLFSTVRN